ncbi:MAG: hypothetical protein HC933_07130 [Pleurocapsa sp. SU_196_0]|nr:hypothetical protein [Pleurocapsa sp. SU_196_0]
MPINLKHLANMVDRIKSIASRATDISENFKKNRLVFITEEGMGFSLNDGVKDEYEKLINEFLNKLKWSEKYTEKKVSEIIKELIVMAMQNASPDEIKKYYRRKK